VIKESGILNINTKNLIYNYNFFKKLKKNLIVAPTIKANAYGLGDKKVFNLLLKNSCKHFFVATLNEGLKLKNKNKLIKIFILNGLQDYNLNRFFNSNLIPVINSLKEYEKLKNSGLKFAIHVDTGINRLGIPIDEIKEIDFKNKNIQLIISHLSSADEYKNNYNLKQKKIFSRLRKKFNNNVFFSLANSHGAILNKSYLYDMIRPGIGIYGGFENKKLGKRIKNVVSLKGKIIQIKDIQKNQYVGYNRTYKTKTKIKVAIIGLGYEDGIPRSLSNNGYVFFKENKFKIIGRISMDTFTVDISKSSHDLNIGMYLDIINDEHKIEKFAKLCKTIPNEVLTSIGKRVYRKYE
tara:strand:+ start:16 stop:1068 length:1053 start_codon:yes stop_codon:yes gene_type:complete